MCELCGVSRSGYYNWVNHTRLNQIERERQDHADFEEILDIFQYRGYPKGYRTIKMMLMQRDIVMNHKKILRLMRKYGLKSKIRRPRKHRIKLKIALAERAQPNFVNREFKAYGPRKVLLTDITYCYFGKYRNNPCYLCTIKDAYTNEILAFSVSEEQTVDLVADCVNQLIEKHKVSLNKETLIHSDQGSQFMSIKFQQLLKHHELIQSMSRRGNCWDNAPQESFFGTLKDNVEFKYCQNFEITKAAITDFIDYYNYDRPQKGLAQLTPSQYYHFYNTGVYPYAHLIDTPTLPKTRQMELDVE